MYNTVAQAIGIIGMVLCLLCYHGKTHKSLLAIKLAADIIWAVHYFMIGGYSGFALNVLCTARETVYMVDKNDKRRVLWLCLFVLANWSVQFFTWKGLTSLFPAIVATIGSYSFWQKNVTVTRVLALVIAALMFTYDLFVMSYAGLLSEALTFVSALAALAMARKKTV